MSYTPLINSTQIYQEFVSSPSVTPSALTVSFISLIRQLNQSLLFKNLNYKVVSYTPAGVAGAFDMSALDMRGAKAAAKPGSTYAAQAGSTYMNIIFGASGSTSNQQLLLISLNEGQGIPGTVNYIPEQALTFTVPTSYTISGTTYQGIPLAGLAITGAIYSLGALTPTISNITATGFPNIVQEAVMLNGSQILNATSALMFNPYGFNTNILWNIQDTLSSYVNDSVSTLGIPKSIIVGFLI